jgi:hypothetical protein
MVPGPSQYELIVSKKSPPKGFEEVCGLYSLGSYTEAHEYWRIANDKLYEISYKYPKDEKQRKWFDFGEKNHILVF